ncbi:MAG TPA: type IV secretion system protein, partial [Allosphingosinicella sp.]|nr:type IV secretion system protein [Allosphingosinicella sp.]
RFLGPQGPRIMNKQSREALDAYYAEAESWAKDRQEELRASRRTAWVVAGAALAVALLEGIALLLLTPLKTVVPYTLLVDRNTGFVQALEPLDPAKVSADTALTQSFLVQYVIARESFDIDTLQADYRKVALWSAEQARSGYVAGMQVSSPQSPLVLYPRTTVVETRVKSVSPVGRNVAMVRFETVRRDAGGRVEPARPWVAVIRYRYSGEPLRLEDRMINPLGFQVLRYRRDPEALPPESPPVVVQPPAVVVPGAVQVQTTRTTETRQTTSDEPTAGAPEPKQ